MLISSTMSPYSIVHAVTDSAKHAKIQNDVRTAKVQSLVASGKVDETDLVAVVHLDSPSVIYGTFDLTIDEEAVSHGKHAMRFNLLKSEDEEDLYMGDEIKVDSFKMDLPKGKRTGDWWYHTDEVMPAGYYGIELENMDYGDNCFDCVKCQYRIYTYNGFAESFTIPSTVNVKTDGETSFNITNINPSGALAGASWTSNNKKIADVFSDHRSEVIVYGNQQGKCTLTGKLINGKTYKCTVNVTNPAPRVNYKEFELCKGETDLVKLKYIKGKVKWKSSNSKIASVTKNGKIKAKKLGKCTLWTKYKGKKYKTTVKVVYQWPNFMAELTDYNTRGNYFSVKFKNRSNKSVTVLSPKAYCMDVDYKAYDRKLQLPGNKSIVIKPKKSKTVKFKVKGRLTWPDYGDFTIRYYFKFDGKKHLGSCWDDDSVFKKGKKWYATYWEDE